MNTTNQLYPVAQLDAARQQTDPIADAVIKEVFKEYSFHQLNEWLGKISVNGSPLPAQMPGPVKEYFEQTAALPAFANSLQMKQGAVFFAKYFGSVLSLLGSYSLPYCYAAADGAQVLWISQRIYQDTFRRLQETGQFVLDVLHKDAFAPAGKGIRSIQKVRLIHAAVRLHLLKSGQWNLDWGQPINQEDMAGTQASFSYIVLEGLTKLGFYYTPSEANAYMHLWKVIGAMLGVTTELLPGTTKEAYWLDRRIKQRHFRKSDAGIGLTKALLECLQHNFPSSIGVGFVPSYVRYLLGNEVADLLEVPPGDWSQAMINPMKTANSFNSVFNPFKSSGSKYMADMLPPGHGASNPPFTVPIRLGS